MRDVMKGLVYLLVVVIVIAGVSVDPQDAAGWLIVLVVIGGAWIFGWLTVEYAKNHSARISGQTVSAPLGPKAPYRTVTAYTVKRQGKTRTLLPAFGVYLLGGFKWKGIHWDGGREGGIWFVAEGCELRMPNSNNIMVNGYTRLYSPPEVSKAAMLMRRLRPIEHVEDERNSLPAPILRCLSELAHDGLYRMNTPIYVTSVPIIPYLDHNETVDALIRFSKTPRPLPVAAIVADGSPLLDLRARIESGLEERTRSTEDHFNGLEHRKDETIAHLQGVINSLMHVRERTSTAERGGVTGRVYEFVEDEEPRPEGG